MLVAVHVAEGDTLVMPKKNRNQDARLRVKEHVRQAMNRIEATMSETPTYGDYLRAATDRLTSAQFDYRAMLGRREAGRSRPDDPQ